MIEFFSSSYTNILFILFIIALKMGSILIEVPQEDLQMEVKENSFSQPQVPKPDDFARDNAAAAGGTKGVPRNVARKVDTDLREQDGDVKSLMLPPDLDPSAVFHRLLLAWILLVRRGSLGHQDENLSISWAVQQNSNGTEADVQSFLLSEAVSKAGSTVAECLATISNLRSTVVEHPIDRIHLKAGVLTEKNADEAIFAIEVVISGQSCKLNIRYCEPELSSSMRRLLLDTLSDIFETIHSQQTLSISDLSQVQPGELTQIWSWNKFPPPSIDRGIHEYFVQNAQRNPSAVAVTSYDGTLTYSDLDALSSRLAYRLRDMGVGRGSKIICCFEKSAWTVVAVLGIMRAGAAFVLTDPSQPEGRLRTIAEEVQVQVVLTSQRYEELGGLIAPSAQVLAIGPALRDDITASSRLPLPAVPGSALMYIIFTSGSTGKPKGVMISHSNYTSGAIPRADIVGYKPETRVLDFASYAFDVSIDCMLLTLATGGCICVPSDDQRVNDLSGAVRDMKVNMVHTTPSIARVFDADVIPSLKVLGLGGEAVPARDASKWNEQTSVVVAYGPSECTVGCAFSNHVGRGKTYTSLGKGCGGLLWIVNPEDHNKLSPVGAAGELLVEGAIVGDGYLNEPEKTTIAFVEDPEWLLKGSENATGRQGRLYKTGDLVRYDPDGSGAVVFVGRKDQQVKIRGQRVELEEVEHHLRQRLPSKTAVAAEIIAPGGDGEPMLAAFVVSYDQRQERLIEDVHVFDPDLQKILSDVEQQLIKDVPKYMVPAVFISVAEIPTTVSGKTDRKYLRALGSSLSRQQLARWRSSTRDSGAARPFSPREQIIGTLWSKVLDSGPLRADDNFFALGGDSLKAMRLVALARKQDLTLSIGLIFSNPTLADMAAKAEQKSEYSAEDILPFSLLGTDWCEEEARRQAASACDVEPMSIEDMYPCTPLQEGLMALSSKVSEAYIAQRVVRLKDKDSATKLRAAFETAARDCPILRTRIIHVSSRGLMQVVLKDCSGWHEATDLQEYLSRDRAESMGLGAQLCRFGLIEDSVSGELNFVLTMHHALYDGWSMPLVVDRVNRAYNDLDSVRRTPFRSFIKYFLDADRTRSEAYWRTLLDGAEERQCPALPYPEYQTKADSLLERFIPVPATSQSNSTLATIIRAAWALTATRYSGSPDVIFGETLTGRNANLPGIEEIEAPLITTVPMRVKVNQATSVSDFLNQIHQQTIDRIPHEQLGLQNIRLLSHDARRACDLRTGFVLHPRAEEEDSGGETKGPASGLVPAGDKEAAQEALKFNSYALMMVCTLETNGFLTMASFDSQTISVDSMQDLLKRFDDCVQVLSSEKERTLGDLFQLPIGNTVSKDKTLSSDDPSCNGRVTMRETRQDSHKFDPRSNTSEQHLASLWGRILKIDGSDLNSNDNFFDLGGDSIGAMKLVSELKHDRFELSVAEIFANRSLGAMAKVMRKANVEQVELFSTSSDSGSGSAALHVDDSVQSIGEKIKPALQDQNWQIEKIYQARPLQSIAVNGTTKLPRYSVRYEKFFFNGKIDKQRLFQSCETLVSINEILRTVFVSVEGQCFAAVVEDIGSSIVKYEIEGEVDSFSQTLCDLDVQIRIPEGSRFVKFFYIENEKGQSSLIFRLSHAQYDEICLPIMLRQLSDLYQGKALERALPFSKFMQHLISDNIPKSKSYWKEYLNGSRMSVLPGPKNITPDRTRWVSLTKNVVLAGRPKDITLATFPTAAWALTLARRLSTVDVVFGEVASGRNTGFGNADSVVGPCWQYIPFRLKLDQAWTFRDVLQAVQDQHIASSRFEGMALSEIRDQCTDWPEDTTWFDSVVHQDVAHVESLPFSLADSRMETYYPHLEPLREWKIQAFAGKDEMMLEVVTFDAWNDFGQELLNDLVKVFEDLVRNPDHPALE